MNRTFRRCVQALGAGALTLGLGVVSTSIALGAEPATAPGLRLSPAATQQLKEAGSEKPAPNLENMYRPHEIRDTGNGFGEGVLYLDGGIFVGRLKRSANPFHPQARYWVFDEGIYTRNDGTRYSGRFHFFHEDWGENGYYQEDWEVAYDGRYILIGSRLDRDGNPASGIYGSDVGVRSVSDFTPADESYLAWFEGQYGSQVQAFRHAQNARGGGGLSFGQVLALGLGAVAMSQADIPSVDAIGIGGAFVTDVLTGGRSDALGRVVEQQRGGTEGMSSDTAAGRPSVAATAADYNQEHVTISCPSGVSNSIPISYRTQACRSAMINYAQVYACNMIDNFASAAQQCKNACGNAQCRE